MKKLLFALILILAVYLVGYWPERGKRSAAEGQLKEQQTQLADSQARVREAELLGQVLNLRDAVLARNYGQAQDLSSKFFDAVRAEEARSPRPSSASAAYEAILGMRDAVTARLTKSDPTVVDLVRQAELRLRVALGYPVPPSTAPPPDAGSTTS